MKGKEDKIKSRAFYADCIVKESNTLARARITPKVTSVWERRVISTVVARNKTSDEMFKEQIIDLREFNSGAALSTRQTKEAQKSIKALGHKAYEVPRPQISGFDVIPIFSIIGINGRDGTVTAELNERLAAHYLNLRKCFTLMSLPDFQRLTSIYSQKLYEILVSYRSEGEKEFSPEELYRLLGVPASFKHFGHFKAYVLDIACREINAAAESSVSGNPLEFEWEAIRPGKRKVTAIRFIFKSYSQEVIKNCKNIRDMLKQ